MSLTQNEPNMGACGRLKHQAAHSHWSMTGHRDHEPPSQVLASEC